MKKFIKVLLGRKQHPNCRKVEFVYDDDGSPTISDVKDAARAQLLISLDNCDVKTRIEDNTVATLADDELYDPDDNIWIDATGSQFSVHRVL
uniref:Uncharacterized protein n=1 Tax=Panagrolaimus superbus TaxID=310955 RepID=A0A914YM91_9BILA